MSRTYQNSTRTRSHSTSRPAPKPSVPDDSFSSIIKKPVPRGPIKIEDRLINFQIQANRRLETLKQSLEQDKLRELQAKPKILKKSRVLAEIHEKKYFSPINPPNPVVKTDQIEINPQEIVEKPENSSPIIVESIPFTNQDKILTKKRAKSLMGSSVIAKSKEFFHNGRENIEKNLKTNKIVLNYNEKSQDKALNLSYQEEKNFGESPSERNLKKIDTTIKYQNDEISTPQSVETYADSVDQKPQKCVNRSLAPFQVRVSFDCGIDLEKFLRRAG